MIYLIGGKDKTLSRKSLLDLKKNYSPDSVQTLVLDKAFEGSLKTVFKWQPLLGGKPAVVLELAPDWKKHEDDLVSSISDAAGKEMDALVWVDGNLPKNSRLYKTITELGGKVTFFDEQGSKEIWELLDALAAKNRGAALAALQQLLDSGESAIGILVMITYETRNLLSAIYQNKSFKALTPWQQKKLLTAQKNFTEEELINLYGFLLNTDMMLKSSNLSEELLLSSLVIGYTGRREQKSTVDIRFEAPPEV